MMMAYTVTCLKMCVLDISALTSNISEVNGLSVGVEQLYDGVVVVLHSAADGGHFPLDHRYVVGCQVLTFDFTTQTKKKKMEKIHFKQGNKHSRLDI